LEPAWEKHAELPELQAMGNGAAGIVAGEVHVW